MELSEQPSLEQSTITQAPEFDVEFSAALSEAEVTLNQLRTRYQEVKTAQVEKAQLEEKLSELQTGIAQKRELEQSIAELETEVTQVQEQIHNLSITLESQLWKWQEPFWQFVRYFGLGFAAAFVLHKLAS